MRKTTPMRWRIIFYSLGLVFLSLSMALANNPGLKVVYVQRGGVQPKGGLVVDPYLGKDLRLKLSALGYRSENIYDRMEEGGDILQNAKILIFSSLCTRITAVNKFLLNERRRLQEFVHKGGCILIFAQELSRYHEELPPIGMRLISSRNKYDQIGYANKKHPIFSRPNGISHRRFDEFWAQGGSLNRLSRSPYRYVYKGHVLAALDKEGNEAFCVEFGWGKGRIIYFACALEGYAGEGESTAKIAMELFENIMSYASDVVKGAPAPLPDYARVTMEEGRIQINALDYTAGVSDYFNSRVNNAVDRGVAWLKSQQLGDGCWRDIRSSYSSSMINARDICTAIALVGILGTGHDRGDSCIQKGMEYLLAHPPDFKDQRTSSHQVAWTMMALDANAAPRNEQFEVDKMSFEERTAFDYQRSLSEAQKVLMTRCRDWILDHRCADGGWAIRNHLDTPSDPHEVHIALQGLLAASRCGLDVGEAVWQRVIDLILGRMETSGPSTKMLEFKKFNASNGKPEFNKKKIKMGLWGQGTEMIDNNCFLSGLLAARDGLCMNGGKLSRSAAKTFESGLSDGLGWLWRLWVLNEQSGSDAGGGGRSRSSRAWSMFDMQSIERVGILSSSKFIGDIDWYRNGGGRILYGQQPTGSFGGARGGVVSTAMALLYLKRP